MPLDFGQTQAGHRRVIPIAGGVVSGPKLQGRVVPGGADWQLLRPGRHRLIWTRAIPSRPRTARSSML